MVTSLSRRFSIEHARKTVWTLCFATLISSSIDIAVSLGLGTGMVLPAPAAYFALTLFLGLAVSVALGFILGGLGISIFASVAVWAFLNAWASSDLIMACLFGGGVWAALSLGRRWSAGAAITGARIGAATGAALVIWPVFRRQVLVSIGSDAILNALVTLSVAAAIYLSLVLVGKQGLAGARRWAETGLVLGLVLFAFNMGYETNRLGPDLKPNYADQVERFDGHHVILLVLDTARADRMSVYGYERPTTPRLEEFLTRHDNAVVYPLAFANSSWTLPSHASLLSGLLPSEHGIHYRQNANVDVNRTLTAERMLAEAMQQAGYRTGASISNLRLTRTPGLLRGFDWWYQPPQTRPLRLLGEEMRSVFFVRGGGFWRGSDKPGTAGLRERVIRDSFVDDVFEWAFTAYARAESINAGVLAFLDACGNGPCFVFANYMEAHSPFLPAPPHAGLFSSGDSSGRDVLEDLSNRYDEEIHSLDARLGELMDEIDRRGMLDNSWVVITSDHGESFGEHGVTYHGTSLYNEQVRVPLIIKPPAGERVAVIRTPVSLVDITSTLADVTIRESLGVGASLSGVSRDSRPSVQMQLFRTDSSHGGGVNPYPTRAVAQGAYKLIDKGNVQELYNLTRDLREQKNLVGEAVLAKRRSLLASMPELPVDSYEAAGQPETEDLSEEDEETLRALGYLE
jgi:arylsulfatase A-like enzyme